MNDVAEKLKSKPAAEAEQESGLLHEKPNMYARLALAAERRPYATILIYLLLAAFGSLAAALWLEVDTDPKPAVRY